MEIDVTSPVHQELVFHLRALKKFLFVVTDEPSLVVKDLEAVLHRHNDRVNVMFRGNWLRTKKWFEAVAFRSEMMPVAVGSALLRAVQSDPRDEQDFFIIPDADKVLFEEGADLQLRALKEQMVLDDRTIKIVIAIGPVYKVPSEFENVFVKIEGRGLTEDEIRNRLRGLTLGNHWKIEDAAYKAGVGLTGHHVDMAYSEAAIRSKRGGRATDPETDPRMDNRVVCAEDIELYRSRQKV